MRNQQKIFNYYGRMNYMKQSRTFQFEEDPFAKNAQGLDKFLHEVLLLLKFLQTEPLNNNRNKTKYDLYYIVTKNLVDKENEEKYEISYDSFQIFSPI